MPRGTTRKTPERVAEAIRLREEEGLIYREIGERLGVSTGTAFEWCADPDGSRLRARKAGYRGACIKCGATTSGCNGPGKAPLRCIPCGQEHVAEVKRAGHRAMVERVERLWAEGRTLRQIALAMGWANKHVAASLIARLRSEGCDLPHRRPQAVAYIDKALAARGLSRKVAA